MQKLFFSLTIVLQLLFFNLRAQEYKIEVQIPSLKDVNVYLGYHFGNEQFVIDTVRLDADGKGVFTGKNKLPEGVYMIVLPRMIYFDFLVADAQKFLIKNDTLDLTNNLQIIGSLQNELFAAYQKYSFHKRKEINVLSEKKALYPDSEKVYNSKIELLKSDISNERNRIIKQNPKTFFALLLKSMSEIDIPIELTQKNDPVTIEKRMDYLSQHFFDNYNFADGRLLYSPVLYNKLTKYFSELVISSTDSIIVSIDRILVKSMQNPEVYQYTLNQLMNLFDVSGDLTNDEAFVYLAENYYFNGLAPWVDDVFIEKLKSHVNTLRSVLEGAIAPMLILSDENEKKISLDEVTSCYTAVVFWSPECEHCADYILGLKQIKQKYPDAYFQVYAVLADKNEEQWKKYIKENKLEWINVYDPKGKNEFIESYKLYMTPRIYILDKTKHILAKDVSAEQLDFMLTKRMEADCK